VVAQVTRITEGVGVYVSLLEYDGLEGMIPAAEASKPRKGQKGTGLGKITRVGKQEVLTVLRVDRGTSYVDLSKRRISNEEKAEAEASFHRSKVVHAIMKHVAATQHVSMEDIYSQTAWTLRKQLECHPYEAFCAAALEPCRILNDELTPSLSLPLRDAVLAAIQKRLAPDPDAKTRVRAEFEARCIGRAGIRAVQAALTKVLALSSDEAPIHLRLVAPPLHTLTCECRDSAKGIAALLMAIDTAAEEMRRQPGGELVVAKEPAAIDESDADKCGADLIARLGVESTESEKMELQ